MLKWAVAWHQQQMPHAAMPAGEPPDEAADEQKKKGRGRRGSRDGEQFAPVNKKKAQNLSIDIGMSLEVGRSNTCTAFPLQRKSSRIIN